MTVPDVFHMPLMKLPGRHYVPTQADSQIDAEQAPAGCLGFIFMFLPQRFRAEIEQALRAESQVQLPDHTAILRDAHTKLEITASQLKKEWYFELPNDSRGVSLHPILARELMKIIYAYVSNQQEICGVRVFRHASGYYLFQESNGRTWYAITSPKAWAAMHLLMQQASHTDDGCYFLPDDFNNPFVESLRSDTDYMLPHHLLRKLKLKPRRV